MYVVAEYPEKSLVYFYPASTDEMAVRLVTVLDLIKTNELCFYYVSVVEDADIMIMANSFDEFLELISNYLSDEDIKNLKQLNISE